MKTEFKLQTITHNTKNISRITKDQAEFLAKGVNLTIDAVIEKSKKADPLDGVVIKLTPGMFLIAISYNTPFVK